MGQDFYLPIATQRSNLSEDDAPNLVLKHFKFILVKSKDAAQHHSLVISDANNFRKLGADE